MASAITEMQIKTTTNSLEWLKLKQTMPKKRKKEKKQTMPSVAMDVGQLECGSYTAGRMKNTTLQNNLL